VAVVQVVNDDLAEGVYLAVRERWAGAAVLGGTTRGSAARAGKMAAAESSGSPLSKGGHGHAASTSSNGGNGGGSRGEERGKKAKSQSSEAAQRRNKILYKLQHAVCNHPSVCPSDFAVRAASTAALLSVLSTTGADSDSDTDADTGERQRQRQRQGPAVEELLRKSGAGGHGCVYAHKGWWTYEVCYREAITQFHVDHPDVRDSMSLGIFDEAATIAALTPRVPYLDPQVNPKP
jgi:hypothetical protein